jgi:hypothetical protein
MEEGNEVIEREETRKKDRRKERKKERKKETNKVISDQTSMD